MKEKRLCVVTMIGGIDLIGDLIWTSSEETARLERPMSIIRQITPEGASLTIFDMMKNGVLSGDSIELNMKNRLYISAPSETIAKIYMAQRGGLVLPQGLMTVNG